MKKYIQLLDKHKRPYQAELIPMDNRLSLYSCLEAGISYVKKHGIKRAAYIQFRMGKDELNTIPYCSPKSV